MRDKTNIRKLLTALFLLLPAAGQAMDNPVQLTVLNGWRNTDGSHVAGIRLDLDEGWKTYWRAPGEGGIPPFFDLVTSDNLRDFEVIWPTPIVFDQSGLRSVGYEHSVVLPLLFWPQDGTKDITLNGTIDIGVCNDICLPVALDLSAALSAEQAKRDTALLGAMAARPFSSEEASVTKSTCRLTPTDGGATLTATVTMPSTGGTEHVIFETSNPDIWIDEPHSQREGETLLGVAELVSMSGRAIMVNRSDIRITVIGTDYAVDIQGCVGG